ncbi:MAG: serpin family protein [Candidatus Limnocylindrales bacterium]
MAARLDRTWTLRLPTWLLAITLAAACTGTTPSSVPTDPPATPSPASPTPSPAPSVAVSPSPAGVELAKANVPRAAATIDDAGAAATAINAFGFDLHRALAASGTNLVASPTSIAIALGMARIGARGQTATEMDAVLSDLATDEHAAWLNGLDQALASRTGSFRDDEGTAHDQTLDISNASFAQRDLAFEPAYLEGLASRFDAGQYLVDYEADAEAARRQINTWANERTRGRIPEVLSPDDISADTRLALVNAIYLKASWAQAFQEDQTNKAPFTRPDGSTVTVPLMRVRGASCGEGDGWAAADIPYLGNQLSMLVIVPDDLAAFERTLDADAIAAIDTTISKTTAIADITLPRFELETRELLGDILADLGMPTAFDPASADFSGMTTQTRLVISKVIHQANISVDEKGTEAAAVTVVGMDTTGGPSETCTAHADRPFLFALRDVETGAILFMGRVVDPSAG